MYNTVTELFLSTYFLFDAIAGKLVGNAKILFDKLYSAFLLPEENRDSLFATTQAETVRDIKTYGDYAQICRIQKFSAFTESDGIPAELGEMVAVKGGALKKVKQFGFDEYLAGTETEGCKLLNDTANMGFISSLCLLGFLQCEGIFVPKSEGLGIKNINKAAQWNSVEGILLALVYDECGRKKNIDRLYTVAKGTLYECVCDSAKKVYGVGEAKFVPENNLLKKAFGAAILKSEVYSPQYARFIFSDLLSFKDKERVLFSSHKELISEAADLPLKLTCGELKFDARAIEELPIVRENEQRRITSVASNIDMRGDATYRPLCIVGDSDYLLGLYATSMSKAFSSAHIEMIEVADLIDYDFEPTKNNVFVRLCEEDKQNVYILKLKGDIRESALNATKNFLQSGKRKEFRLLQPGATIDLSAVLPICICDRQNAKFLKQFCDIVTLAPASEAEKIDLLAYVLQEKARKFEIMNLQVDGQAQAALAAFSVDRAENLIDRAVRYNRGAASFTVSADMIKELTGGESAAKNKYGFGGA